MMHLVFCITAMKLRSNLLKALRITLHVKIKAIFAQKITIMLIRLLAALLLVGIFTLQEVEAQKSLDKKIGQMLLIGFRGMDAKPESQIVKDIRRFHIGGIVLFDYDVKSKAYSRNVQSPEQLRQLCSQLKAASPTSLFIAIDQEGGKVNRLKSSYGFPPSISADSLGKINNLDTTSKRASVIAQTLRQTGINLNFAPVVDLDTCPVKDSSIIHRSKRSYGIWPDQVTPHALAFIQAHHREGILTALKHFPGHGSAKGDTHGGFVNVTQVWKNTELEPFRRLIASGNCDILMTAHVFNAWLDPLHPATLSKQILTGIVREEYGYDGVIITDDMQMGAIAKNYGLERAMTLAVNAGADILLFGNNLEYDPQIAETAFTTLKKLVKERKISKKRIRQSYKRIQRLKKKLKN
jgi:beta-N-acetylhexosaminidase